MPQHSSLSAGTENSSAGFFDQIRLTGQGISGFLGINDNFSPAYRSGQWFNTTHTFLDSYGQQVVVRPSITGTPDNPQIERISVSSHSPTGTPESTISFMGLEGYLDPWGSTRYRYNGISFDTYRELVGSDASKRQVALESILNGPSDSTSYVRGGPKDDRLTGYAGNDQIYGGYGDDIIIGRDASQNLIGEQGDDTIYAKSNNVVKTSYWGHESSELDTVVFSAKSRGIRIRDFDPEHVSIIIDGKTSRKKISFREGTFSSNGGENNGQYLMIKNKPAAFLDYASRFTEKQLLKSVSSLDLRLETLSIDDSFSALIGLNS